MDYTDDFDEYAIDMDEDCILQDYDDADAYAKYQEDIEHDSCDIDFG